MGRWHFVFRIIENYASKRGMAFDFGFFKLLEYPPVGEVVQKKHYKGFWFRADWRWTLDLQAIYNLPTLEELETKTKNLWQKLRR